MTSPKRAKNFQPNNKGAGRSFRGGSTAFDALYQGNDWRGYRIRFLKVNSRCYACGLPSAVVDHVRPHKGDVALFKQPDNHLPLCARCHNTVTGLFDRNFTTGNPITPKLEWLAKMRVARGLDFRVKVLSYP